MAHWSSCSINNGPALPVGDCDCGDDAPMTAEIIQFVPRPNPDRERRLAEEAAKILVPFVETVGFTAPEKDPS